jgi:hypothetical protein
LVSKQNQIAKKLTLSELGTPKIIDSFQPLSLHPVFKNENLAATQASGSAVIKNWLGTEVARFEFFPDNVLGFSQRPARALDRNNLDSLEPTDLYFDPKLLLGPYTIEYSLYNQEEVKIIKASVVAIPFLILAAILAGGGVAIWYKQQVIRKNPFI